MKEKYQILAGLAATFGVISDGMQYGWSAPALPILLSNEQSPFPFRLYDILWIEVALLLGSLIGIPIAVSTVNRFGRKKPILLANGLSVIAWVVIGSAGTVELIYFARFLAGISLRVASIAATLYMGEITDQKVREWLDSLVSEMMIVGLLVVYVSVPFLPIFGPPLIGVCILLLQIITLLFVPESHHYYLLKGQRANARKSLQIFRNSDSVEEELEEIWETLTKQEEEKKPFAKFIKVDSHLKTLLIVMCVSCGRQVTGFSVIVMNIHIILEHAHSKLNFVTVAALFAIFMGLGTLLGTVLVRGLGRKGLLLLSSFGTGVILLVFGIYFSIEKRDVFISWIPAVLVVLYAILFQLGLGLKPRAFAEELFPKSGQEVGCAIGEAASVAVAIVMLALYSLIDRTWGMDLPLYISSILTFLLYLFIIFALPDVNHQAIEETQPLLDTNYDIPHRTGVVHGAGQ